MQISNKFKIRQKNYCEVNKGGGIFVVQFKDSLRHSFNHDKPFAWQCVKKKKWLHIITQESYDFYVEIIKNQYHSKKVDYELANRHRANYLRSVLMSNT